MTLKIFAPVLGQERTRARPAARWVNNALSIIDKLPEGSDDTLRFSLGRRR